MNTISKYILVIISLFLLNGAVAQDGDAIFNKVIKEYTLNNDGSNEYHEYKEVKILSHTAFHRYYGETFVIYDPKYQELEINEAYTIMADGRRVEVPDNAFNEVLPRAAYHIAPYNHLREMVITHTGLEVGATIYLDYTIKTAQGYMPDFMGEEVINDIVPIKDKEVIINVPSGVELHHKMLNLRTGPEITQGKGITTYTFSFKGLKPYTREWGVDNELHPRLFFSASKDFERAYFPFVGQKAFTYLITPEMEKAVNKVKDEKDNELAQVLAIQNMVVNETGNWNLPLQYTAFACRTPEQVWKSNAGTKLEKTVLLASLLRSAGFRAVAVAIIPDKYFDRQHGNLYTYKDFAVQLRTATGEGLYLSATENQTMDLAYTYGGKKLIILDGAIESVRAFEVNTVQNEIIYQGKLVNDENEKIKGKLSIKLVGAANPYLKLSQDTGYAKRYARGVENVELKTINENEAQFDLEVVQKNVFKQYGDYIFMNIPESGQGISSWGFTYIEAGRQAPIRLRDKIIEKYYYEIAMPDGYTLVSPEVKVDLDNTIGKVTISLEQKGNTIISSREIALKTDFVDYKDFAAFTEIWEAWMNQGLKEIIFKK